MLLNFRQEFNKYAPVPFWSWNNSLDRAEIESQIIKMYEKQFGGFIIHARAGLSTPYLKTEWFECVETAIITAKKLQMKVWLYDEFGFPSGLAGGENLKDENKRAKYLEYKKENSFSSTAFSVFVYENGNYKQVNSPCGATTYHTIYLKTSETEVDVLNSQVAKNLIKTTHEEYFSRFNKYFGDTVEGFFTDEPQYFRYQTPFSFELEKELSIDIKSNLIWLFVQDERGYPFRVKYYTALNRLYTLNYYKVIYDWCEEHGVKLTGHTVEEPHLYTQMWCSAGAMPSYKYSHVPGIDHLCKHTDGTIEMKQVSSVASQLKKPAVLTESFGCSGLEVNPRRLKFLLERQYVNGINYLVYHLMNYSIQGQGITDNPPDFSPHTPWWEDIGVFNTYFAKLGYILRNTKEQVNTLVVHPMQSAYLDYLRDEDDKSIKTLDEEFTKLNNFLSFNGVRYHFGDEWILEKHAKVSGDKIIVGDCVYDKIIIPYTKTISKSTYELIASFYKNGGKLHVYKDFPNYISGEKSNVCKIKSSCRLEDIVSNQSLKVKYIKGDKVVTRHVKGELGEFLHVVNFDENNFAEITFDEINSFSKYDILTGELSLLSSSIKLAPCEAITLKREKATIKQKQFKNTVNVTDKFSFKARTENQIMLDYISYSFNGIDYSEPVFYSQMIDGLIKNAYKGNLYVRYYFDLAFTTNLTLVTGNTRVKKVTLDGADIKLINSDYDICYKEATLKSVGKGTHYIEFLVDYYESPNVSHVIFDEGVTESLKNCIVYDTTIEPIYLKGDFSVFKEGVILPPTKISGTHNLEEKGLKFFAGKVSYVGEIEIESKNAKLTLNGEYMTARVYVNNNYVGAVVLDKDIDISNFVKLGKNKIEITITSSLRNAYGPHHVKGLGEIYGIIPRMFTFRGCWENDSAVLYGQSYFSPGYEFVPFGLSEIILNG